MKNALLFVAKALLGGLFLVVPIYLAVLLLLKGMKSVADLVRPFALLLPEWVPAGNVRFLLLVLAICFLIGIAFALGQGWRSGSESRKLSSKEFWAMRCSVA
jgi:hypothetical protein